MRLVPQKWMHKCVSTHVCKFGSLWISAMLKVQCVIFRRIYWQKYNLKLCTGKDANKTSREDAKCRLIGWLGGLCTFKLKKTLFCLAMMICKDDCCLQAFIFHCQMTKGERRPQWKHCSVVLPVDKLLYCQHGCKLRSLYIINFTSDWANETVLSQHLFCTFLLFLTECKHTCFIIKNEKRVHPRTHRSHVNPRC